MQITNPQDIPNLEERVSKIREQIIDLPYHCMNAVWSEVINNISMNLYYQDHKQD